MKVTIEKAPACLNMNDKVMWVTGWNEAVDAMTAKSNPPESFCRAALIESLRAYGDGLPFGILLMRSAADMLEKHAEK